MLRYGLIWICNTRETVYVHSRCTLDVQVGSAIRKYEQVSKTTMVKSNCDPQSQPPHCIPTVQPRVDPSLLITLYQVRTLRNTHTIPGNRNGLRSP